MMVTCLCSATYAVTLVIPNRGRGSVNDFVLVFPLAFSLILNPESEAHSNAEDTVSKTGTRKMAPETGPGIRHVPSLAI